jgi:SEC-C motif-containing protein
MRSRFSAFAVADTRYLLETWHPSTRPDRLDLDDSLLWTHLDIVDAVDGGLFDTTGAVEFRAHYRSAGVRRALHERSTFVRDGGAWRYVGGVVECS